MLATHHLTGVRRVSWRSRVVAASLVRWKIVVVERGQLRAGQAAKRCIQMAVQERQSLGSEWVGCEHIRQSLLDVLIEEASQVVAFEEHVGVVYAVGEVGEVDTSVCVDLVEVSTKSEGFGVGSKLREEVTEDTSGGCVWLGGRAAVPVLQEDQKRQLGCHSLATPYYTYVWNSLLALVPSEVGVVTRDCEKLLEDVSIQVAIRLLGGVIGHHGNDEVVRCRCHQCRGEQWSEVIGVCVDRADGVFRELPIKLVQGVSVVIHA